MRGGPHGTLSLLRVAQRAGQSDWKADRRDDRRAALDYAQVLEELSDVHFPDAEQITLVEDNLSTYTAASLYSAFSAPEPPRKAVRMALRSQTGKLARHGRIRTRRLAIRHRRRPRETREAQPSF